MKSSNLSPSVKSSKKPVSVAVLLWNLLISPELWFAVLVAALFSVSLRNGFVFDDEHFVVKNIFLTSWKFLPSLLTKNMVAGMGMASNFYRPLESLTHFIDYQLWGLRPWGHHLTNLIIHTAASVLVFRWLSKIFSRKTAFFAALFFTLHPIQSEIVAYVSGRGDSLGILFLMAGLLLFSSRPKMTALCQILAMGSKESLILFPVYLILSEKLQKRKIQIRGHIWFWLISMGYFILRVTVLNFKNTFNFYDSPNSFTENFSFRLWTYLSTLPKAVLLWILPYDLHHERSWPIFTSPLLWPVLSAILFLGCLALLARLKYESQPKMAWGLVWFLAGTFPTSNLIFLINAIFYDHWFVLPGLGLVVAGAAAIENFQITHPTERRFLLGLVMTMMMPLSMITWRTSQMYQTPESLYQGILRWEPDSAKITSNYAMALSDSGRVDEAITWYKKSIALSDEYPETHHNLGIAYRDKGRYDEALQEFDRALKMAADFYHAWIQKGIVYSLRKDWESAAQAFSRSVQIYPMDLSSYAGLIQAKFRQGNLDGARAVYESAKNQFPEHSELDQLWQDLNR